MPVLALACLLGALLAGYRMAVAEMGALPADLIAAWKNELSGLEQQTQTLRERANSDSRAYAARVATLQARLLRMEAVGERLAESANLEGGEFDFRTDPALGGPSSDEPVQGDATQELNQSIAQLGRLIDDRERQFGFLEDLLSYRTLSEEVTVTGKPVRNGYLSSRFGIRTDPFDGNRAWHKGVDFTAPVGTPVIALASGVVTSAARDGEYGNVVELRHSDGYRTRYAHNRELLVKAGDRVKKGQVIAKVGRTGRASGSHLHLEVLRDGKLVDPMAYISAHNQRG